MKKGISQVFSDSLQANILKINVFLINRMNRILSVVGISILLLTVHSAAYALAISDIQLNSALNQPLDATVQILSATPQELDSLNLSVSRISGKSTGNYHWPDIKVELVHAEKGKSYLKVTSKDVVREPILNFLLELDWATGRIKREYSLLINPQH